MTSSSAEAGTPGHRPKKGSVEGEEEEWARRPISVITVYLSFPSRRPRRRARETGLLHRGYCRQDKDKRHKLNASMIKKLNK